MVKAPEQIASDVTRKALGSSSARNVLQLLFSFSERRVTATVPDLAELVGIPVPTAYRHIALLKDLQLLAEGPIGSYHPTAKVMALARAAQLANGLADLARPVVEEAAAAFNETVMLMQCVGDAVVCVEVKETQRPMRLTFQRGHTVALGRGASGKMALASLPIAAREAFLATLEHPTLERELLQISASGFATSTSEMDDGVWACSVAVAPYDRAPLVLTVAGPESRFDARTRESVPDRLMVFAEQLRTVLARYAF